MDETQQTIQGMIDQGIGIKEMSKRLHMSRDVVRRHVVSLGYDPSPARSHCWIKILRDSDAIEMYQRGMHISEIADHFDVQRAAIRNLLKRNNIPLRGVRNSKGANNPAWKGGRQINKDGYVYVHAPKGHPGASTRGLILEHRLVMEAHLGRYLDPQEVVHHVNGDRTDNRIENLGLFDSQREHRIHHVEESRSSATP